MSTSPKRGACLEKRQKRIVGLEARLFSKTCTPSRRGARFVKIKKRGAAAAAAESEMSTRRAVELETLLLTKTRTPSRRGARFVQKRGAAAACFCFYLGVSVLLHRGATHFLSVRGFFMGFEDGGANCVLVSGLPTPTVLTPPPSHLAEENVAGEGAIL